MILQTRTQMLLDPLQPPTHLLQLLKSLQPANQVLLVPLHLIVLMRKRLQAPLANAMMPGQSLRARATQALLKHFKSTSQLGKCAHQVLQFPADVDVLTVLQRLMCS